MNIKKVEYVKGNEKVIIICTEHGEFLQSPTKHLGYHGCPKCGKKLIASKQTSNTQEFINKAIKVYGNKYDYKKS